MNPRVTDLASKVGFDAASYTWFDFTDLADDADKELVEIGRQHGLDARKFYMDELPTPSESMAVIQPAFPDTVFTYDQFIKIGKYEGAAVMLWGNDGSETPLAIMTGKNIELTNGGDRVDQYEKNLMVNKVFIETLLKNGMTQESAIKLVEDICISAVNYACLVNLRAHTTEQVLTAHMAKGMDFINRKRKAKNQPLLYSWNTIELKPQPQIRQPHKGGTHASPARHKRRAHLRRLRTGGFTWIPEMWVGNIENGLIVHDYVPDRELTKEGK